MSKRHLLAIVALFFVAALPWDAAAKDYHFISPEALKTRLQESSPMIVIDICEAEQFARGHIKGAIETGPCSRRSTGAFRPIRSSIPSNILRL